MTATEERPVAVRTMSVTIDGHQVTVGEGTTIFDAAKKVGVDTCELLGDEAERLLPARLAEVGQDLVVVH